MALSIMTRTRSEIRTPSSARALALICTFGLLGLCLFAPSAEAQVTGATPRPAKRSASPPSIPTTETWEFDETTTGGDILWTSPTSVHSASPFYVVQFSISAVEVSASWIGINLGFFDVIDQVPPEFLVNSLTISGPAPLSLLNIPVEAPPPPDPIAIGATISVELDAIGHANLLASNIVLGTFEIDTGFPFGVQTVSITGFRIAGAVTITPVPWRPLPL
jgi:hypothetical protein